MVKHPFLEIHSGRSSRWYFCFVSGLLKKIENNYRNLIQQHDIKSRIRDDNTVNFDQLISTRFRWSLYAIALILYIGTFIIRGQFSAVINTVGLMIGFIKTGIIIPFVYIPIGVEFAAIYTSIHIDLPRRVRRADLEMDFTDPMNFGGMYYFGELIRHSYYMFIILIIAFLFWTYAPRVSDSIIYYPYPEAGFETTVQFIIFWAIGTVFLVHSVWIFHAHMTKAKREKVKEINQHFQELGDDDRSIPETQPEMKEILYVQLEHDKSRRVRDMHEYPFNAEMIYQLVLSVLLPLALERILNTIF
ncbi:hypothetical protein [Halalkalicoccus salilacus]|uniref:hypothetical protein n=1 Tax=Halalkalicoccus salilacus TaxID=3117459 RepID=UPI00300F4045